MALVTRCSKITELVLSGTSITNNSVDSIVKHLDSSLEKLDVSGIRIDSTALLRLGTVRTLKVLNWRMGELEKFDEIKNLRKKLSGISINKEDVFIATPNATPDLYSNIRLSNSVSSFEDGFWEIKARQQEMFTRNE